MFKVSSVAAIGFAMLILPTVASGAEEQIWSGPYIGIAASSNAAKANYSDPLDGHIGARMSAADSDKFDAIGVDFRLGYLKQAETLVYGAEIEAGLPKLSGCINTNEPMDADGCPYGHSIETEVKNNFGINGKLGVSIGDGLVYGLGGVNLQKVHSTYNDWTFGGDDGAYDPLDGDTVDSSNKYVAGWKVGAGAQYMFVSRFSVFAEGAYSEFSHVLKATNLSNEEEENTNLKTNFKNIQVSVGINYHF